MCETRNTSGWFKRNFSAVVVNCNLHSVKVHQSPSSSVPVFPCVPSQCGILYDEKSFPPIFLVWNYRFRLFGAWLLHECLPARDLWDIHPHMTHFNLVQYSTHFLRQGYVIESSWCLLYLVKVTTVRIHPFLPSFRQ